MPDIWRTCFQSTRYTYEGTSDYGDSSERTLSGVGLQPDGVKRRTNRADKSFCRLWRRGMWENTRWIGTRKQKNDLRTDQKVIKKHNVFNELCRAKMQTPLKHDLIWVSKKLKKSFRRAEIQKKKKNISE